MAIMVLVDEIGGVYPHVNHSPWNNITFADLVMPWSVYTISTHCGFVQPYTASFRVGRAAYILYTDGTHAGFYSWWELRSRFLWRSSNVGTTRKKSRGPRKWLVLTISAQDNTTNDTLYALILTQIIRAIKLYLLGVLLQGGDWPDGTDPSLYSLY